MTAAASSTLSASEIGQPAEDLQSEVTEQTPETIHQGARVTLQNVELMKAVVSCLILDI